MKNTLFYSSLLFIAVTTGCNNETVTNEPAIPAASATDSAKVNGVPADITIQGIHFTRSINGADTLINTSDSNKLVFKAGEKKDYFSDPDGQLSNNTAPILLSKVDNTKPFTLVAKVTPLFNKTGLYNAGVLYVYVNDNYYQKLCFEQDERGDHRVVSVRTVGTSDDNNHDKISTPYVYMKISSDTKTIASYYSYDNKTWQLARLYKNDYPAEIWTGISTQCPVDTGTQSSFEELSLTQTSVKDFRLGN